MPLPEDSIRVAIAGASSLRGQDLAAYLEESGFPAGDSFDDDGHSDRRGPTPFKRLMRIASEACGSSFHRIPRFCKSARRCRNSRRRNCD
jgi:hypothetical protein